MSSRERKPVTIGVALRHGRECSALCVAERDCRQERGQETNHFIVRYLERLPPRTPFVLIASRVAEIAAAAEERGGERPWVYVDASGGGEPIVDLFREHRRLDAVYSCYFNHGDQRVADGWVIRLGKGHVVGALKALLQARRLHLPRTPESRALAADLLDFEIQIAPNANELQGAFRVGPRDDLVTALGLAVGAGPRHFPTFRIF